MTLDSTPVASTFRVIAAYKFAALAELPELKQRLHAVCKGTSLKGTILLSPEGINMFMSGTTSDVDTLLSFVRTLRGLEDIETKVSESTARPFKRMLIKIKPQIICFDDETVSPAERTSPKLPAKQLKEWLDEGRPVTLLDTRNEYEVRVGTFQGAIDPGLTNFRDFPKVVDRLPAALKDEPVVIFCTGGIRCEKAGPFLESKGFKKVFQLEGGILKYFEECGNAHYDGACFVFDDRVAVDATLQEAGTTLCGACSWPLTREDQRHPHYVWQKSCHRCFGESTANVAASQAP